MKYEDWYLDQIMQVVYKNPFSSYEYTKKCYYELAKSIKTSLKRQKIFPQNNWQFERKINFGILKFTNFSIRQMVNITNFYYQDVDTDFKEFYAEFKSHKFFYVKGYMKSSDFNVLSYQQWFYYEFAKAHNEFHQQFKIQLEAINAENARDNLQTENEEPHEIDNNCNQTHNKL